MRTLRYLRWLLRGNGVALVVSALWIVLVYLFVPVADGRHAIGSGTSALVQE